MYLSFFCHPSTSYLLQSDSNLRKHYENTRYISFVFSKQFTGFNLSFCKKYCHEKLSFRKLNLGEYGWKYLAQKNFPSPQDNIFLLVTEKKFIV